MAVVVVAFDGRAIFSDNGSEIREATLIGVAYLENLNVVHQFGPTDVMGHTWSLATEEQFYFLWPLILPLVLKKRPLVWLCAGIVAMMIARFVFWREDIALSHSPFLRPIGLLVGCALAFLPIQNRRLPRANGPCRGLGDGLAEGKDTRRLRSSDRCWVPAGRSTRADLRMNDQVRTFRRTTLSPPSALRLGLAFSPRLSLIFWRFSLVRSLHELVNATFGAARPLNLETNQPIT
jgi:hypothetical protein